MNAPPHVGFALEEVQADVLARTHRAKGERVFFLTGTDEHGIKIARVAAVKGISPERFTDEISLRFRELKGALNLSWDGFIRTTDKERHWPGAVLMWKSLVAAGDIYKKSYKGLYCVGHEAFITQKDMVDGLCVDHKTKPEEVEEENYFFKLSKYSKTIGEKIRNGEFEIVPAGRRNEILSLIDREGLEDISFSRPRKDLSWGVPVPDDETQTMYVWCDALTNYLSAIGYGSTQNIDMSQFRSWWPADVQCIGKDILRFHAAIWLGMLLSAGLPLPKKLFVHGFITVDGQKMSKTIGNVVDPFELVKKYATDAVRYYLLREIPTGEDGDFSEEKFKVLYNADLANGLGNFAARVLKLGEGLGEMKKREVASEISGKIENTRKLVANKIQEFKFHEALADLWALIAFGDEYINAKAPWKLTDIEEKTGVIFNLISILDNIAAMLQPFLPETSEKITASITWSEDNLKVKEGEVLFPRL